MSRTALLAIALLFCCLAQAEVAPAPADLQSDVMPKQPCSDFKKGFPPCGLTKSERQQARQLYEQAAKLAEDQHLIEALDKMREARAISPRDTIYAIAEARIRQKLVAVDIRLGNQAILKGNSAEALGDFRRAAELDPANAYALQRLRDAMPVFTSNNAQLHPEMGETRLQPAAASRSIEFKGGSTELIQQFGHMFGVSAIPDEGLSSRPVRVKLDNVSWENGSEILARVCKVLLIPLTEHQVLIANDTEENRRDLTRMSLRTFYAVGGSSPTYLTDLSTGLRILFDLKYITPNPAMGTIVIRAPQQTMSAVTDFVEYLQEDRPDVILQVKVFEVSSVLNRDLGTTAPDSFTIFNVPTEIQNLVNSSTYSEIISALQSSGQTVNATTILAALLASGSTSSSSVLSQPFGVFGGGTTLTGVTIPATSLSLSVNNSLTHTVDDVLLRSAHGQTATMKIGERYPIVTSVFSATSASSSLLSTLGLSNTVATAIPSPQFTYEDVGLVFKAVPKIHGKSVSLDYELTLRSLGATQANGLPLLTNREMKGSIGIEDGEPVVIAGMVDQEEMASINGIPLLSMVPGLGQAFSTTTREKMYDELLLVLTPHITSLSTKMKTGSYIKLPTNVPK